MMLEDAALITYEGWNLERFIISGEGESDRGIVLAPASKGTAFEDMYDAPVSTIYNSTAFQIGATFGGTRDEMYNFTLAFHVKKTGDASWRLNESRFRKALSYKKNCKIEVRVDDSYRWLNVKMFSNPKLRVEFDPNSQKYGLLLVTFAAEYPRWLEDDVTDTFTTVSNTVGGGTELSVVTVSNPTDVEIWLKWVTQGIAGIIWILPDFSFNDDRFDRAVLDDDRMVQLPELLANEHVLVDTDEMADQVNSSLDTAVYQRMNGRQFLYPIPPYTEPIDIMVAVQKAPIGAGLQVRCPRAWTRPWGLE